MKTKEINLGYIKMASYKTNQPLLQQWQIDEGETSPEPSEVVLKSGNYKLVIDYPLTNPYVHSLPVGPEGMTRRSLVNTVVKAYKEIYASEKDPGNIPGMLNRNTSEGPYGIWGHDLGDLILHTAYVKGDKIEVSCDS